VISLLINDELWCWCRRRGDPAAPGGDRGAGRGAAGEQRSREHARRGVPARGGHRAVRANDTGEPVGADGGDGGGAAADAGAGEGRRRQRRLGLHGGRPVLPALHRLQFHEKVLNLIHGSHLLNSAHTHHKSVSICSQYWLVRILASW
jgi:hypothetical protein